MKIRNYISFGFIRFIITILLSFFILSSASQADYIVALNDGDKIKKGDKVISVSNVQNPKYEEFFKIIESERNKGRDRVLLLVSRNDVKQFIVTEVGRINFLFGSTSNPKTSSTDQNSGVIVKHKNTNLYKSVSSPRVISSSLSEQYQKEQHSVQSQTDKIDDQLTAYMLKELDELNDGLKYLIGGYKLTFKGRGEDELRRILNVGKKLLFVGRQYLFAMDCVENRSLFKEWTKAHGLHAYESIGCVYKMRLVAEIKPNGVWEHYLENIKVEFGDWQPYVAPSYRSRKSLYFQNKSKKVIKMDYWGAGLAPLSTVFSSLHDLKNTTKKKGRLLPKKIKDQITHFLKVNRQLCIDAVNSQQRQNQVFQRSQQVRRGFYSICY